MYQIDNNNKFKDAKCYKYWLIHRLVIYTFKYDEYVRDCIGENPKVICHIDGDKDNNRLSNLWIDSQSNNMIDNLRTNVSNL